MNNEEKEYRKWQLKSMLKNSDYITLKYMEGQITENEFQISKVQRAEWRRELEELEKK